MGFLCKKNELLIVPQEEITEVKLLRDVGLDNVYNIKTDVNVCREVFISPEFNVSGAETICKCPDTFIGHTTIGNLPIDLYSVPTTNSGDCEDINSCIRSAINSVELFYNTYNITSATTLHIEDSVCGRINKFSCGDSQIWLTQAPNGTTGWYFNDYRFDPLNIIKYDNSLITPSCCTSLNESFQDFNEWIESVTGMTQFILDLPSACGDLCCMPFRNCNNLPIILTACTTGGTSVYNLDYTPNFNIDFTLTGSTDYTGYTGNFCYKVFSDDRFVSIPPYTQIIDGSEIINGCTEFSAITSTTVTQQFVEGKLPKNWGQYMVRPYYKFVSKDCNPGLSFNTWDSTIQNNIIGIGDSYFMTVIDPPEPILPFPGGVTKPNFTLVTDRLYVNGVSGQRGTQSIDGDLNYFLLGSVPSNGTLILTLNGVQLTNEYDYRLISQGSGAPPIIELINSLKITDWLLATYIIGVPDSWSTDFGIFFMDQIVLDGYTIDATPAYRLSGDNTLNSNTIAGTYEFFTSLPIDQNNSIIVTVNGIKLAENSQFFKSTSFDGRIIFNKDTSTFINGDVITVLAVSKNGVLDFNYGSLKVPEFTANWYVPESFTNNSVTGKFILQTFDVDTNNQLNYGVVDFVRGQSYYEYKFTSLPLGTHFRFSVTFEATYTGYFDNKVTTCSVAEGYFDTDNEYIKNTY